jgi:hypothetical protein
MFVFLSGYGMECSFHKNGLTNYWDKRVRKIYIPALFVNGIVCGLIIVGIMDTGYALSKENMLEGIFMITRYNYVNGPTWYITYIFIWYLIFYISHMFKNKRINIMILLIFSLFMYYITPAVFPAANTYILAFVVGIIFWHISVKPISPIKYRKALICGNALIFAMSFYLALLIKMGDYTSGGTVMFRANQMVLNICTLIMCLCMIYIISQMERITDDLFDKLHIITDMEFELYLWRVPILLCLSRALSTQWGISYALSVMICFPILIGVAYIHLLLLDYDYE